MEPSDKNQPKPTKPSSEEVIFQSSDISKTKSAKPSEYFIQIKDSPESRRKRNESRRAQRREARRAKCQALKARRQAKSLSRRTYFLAWLKIYRGPIAIIFLSVTAVAIIIGIIIAVTWPQAEECPSSPTYSSEHFQELIKQATESSEGSDDSENSDDSDAPTNTINDPEALINICNEQANIATSPEDKAEVYLTCADQVSINFAEEKADLVLEYAYKAEEVAPSSITAQAIASYEELYGSPEKSLEYQDIVLERTNGPTDYSEEPGNSTEGDWGI